MNRIRDLKCAFVYLTLFVLAGCGGDLSPEIEADLFLQGGIKPALDFKRMAPFPSIVGLHVVDLRTSDGQACTGVRVTQRRILTAAHCLDHTKTGNPLVVDLSLSNSTFVSKVAVKKVSVHPSYLPVCAGLCADLAIIEVEPTSQQSQSIALNSWVSNLSWSLLSKAQDVVIAGMGCEKFNAVTLKCDGQATLFDGFWKYEYTTVKALSHPINVFSEVYFSTDGAKAQNAPGDSGGPVFDADGNVVGINSFKIRTAEPNYHVAMSHKLVRDWLEPLTAGRSDPALLPPSWFSVPAGRQMPILRSGD